MKIFCPKCNTPAYDKTSLFCYKCGRHLPVHIKEKEKGHDQTLHIISVPVREFMNRDDSQVSTEPALIQPFIPESSGISQLSLASTLIQPVKPESSDTSSQVSLKPSANHPVYPVEFCAQCGGLVTDKSRIFCENCGAYIREELCGNISPSVKPPDLGPQIKSPAAYRKPGIRTIKERDVELTDETSVSLNAKPAKWKLIAIVAGILSLLFIFMLMLFMIYLNEVNTTFASPP